MRDEGGLGAGLYPSHSDWTPWPSHPQLVNSISVAPASGVEDTRAWDRYLDYRDGQARKLLTRFGPDLLWFDCAWERSAAYWRVSEPTRTIRDLAPDAVCNFRLLGHGDYATLEQGLPVSASAAALGVVPHRAYY
ncbi:alpha-L-fucosidase [Streptomyces sp. H23]|uniref:alpha-L-fucosidase n=1 Tax=unclassified Streptomyces TaxID=2593676 RepID=UPI001F1018B9|nr:alpha-L-fucosidase [Streptomyces sp. H23]